MKITCTPAEWAELMTFAGARMKGELPHNSRIRQLFIDAMSQGPLDKAEPRLYDNPDSDLERHYDPSLDHMWSGSANPAKGRVAQQPNPRAGKVETHHNGRVKTTQLGGAQTTASTKSKYNPAKAKERRDRDKALLAQAKVWLAQQAAE
jgi:hypothetical protein